MRFPLLIAFILLIVNVAVDFYIYCALYSHCRKSRFWPRVQAWSATIFSLAFVTAICLPKRGGPDIDLDLVIWIVYSLLSVYIPKYLFIIFDILSRLPLLWHGRRWRWLSFVGVAMGIAVFATMWWGAAVNRFIIRVEDVEVEIPGLPAAFDGYKIAQISDLHLGTYVPGSPFITKLVDELNGLNANVIVFTGDLVNRKSSEAVPFTEQLSKLHAPAGVYSILGNHDYADYSDWKSAADKEADVASLIALQSKMGWHLLNNETVWLYADGDSIALIGVENVGDPPFRTYGDLHKAYPYIADGNTKILLSHNPAHWVNSIADNPDSNIALTLSGHTHAMQMRFFGFSPSAWRYPKWAGLYSDAKGQLLYVNIGIGEVGFPARLGSAKPEITLFTLKSK